MRILALLVVAAGVLTLAQAGASSNPAGFTCTGGSFELTPNNWNGGGVSGGGAPTPITTNGQAYCLDQIVTYHLSTIGTGATGGSVSLHVDLSMTQTPGSTIGPWAAVNDHQATTGFANWIASSPSGPPIVINGSYTCNDSDPTSWAQNATSSGQGFCKVLVRNTTADPTPPTVSLTAPTGGLEQGTVTFTATANDVGSGVARVEFQTSPATANAWTTRATATDASWTATWNSSLVPDGSYDVRAVAYDNADNADNSTATSPVTIGIDNTGPSVQLRCNGGSFGNCGGWFTSTPVSVESLASDNNGIGPTLYTTDGTNPLFSHSAQPMPEVLSLSQSTVLKVGASDGLGNLTVVTQAIQIDTTAPPAPHIVLGPSSQNAYVKQTRADGFVVWYRPSVAGVAELQVSPSDDPESGVASVDFPATLTPTTWHPTIGGPLDASYAWDASPATGPSFSVKSTNNAHLLGPTSDVGFNPDPNQPTGGIDCVPASCTSATGPVTVTLTANDFQSGIKEIRYTTDGTDPGPGHGTVGTTLTVTQPTPNIKFWGVDNVGNAGMIATGGVAQAAPQQGGTILFQSTRPAIAGSGYAIWKTDIGSTTLTELSAASVVARRPDASRDGTHIVWEAGPENGAQLALTDAAGTPIRMLTTGFDDHAPAFSPDGTKVAFSRHFGAPTSAIMVLDLNSGQLTNITGTVGGVQNDEPTWSADGARIAYARTLATAGAKPDIVIQDAVANALVTTLTTNSGADFDPTFSPDGTKIAFDTIRGNTWPQIAVMNADGTNQQVITTSYSGFNDSGDQNSDPAWSPDGSRIAFVFSPGGAQNFDVMTMNPDGTQRVKVTDDPNTAPAYDGYPAWLPATTAPSTSCGLLGNCGFESALPAAQNNNCNPNLKATVTYDTWLPFYACNNPTPPTLIDGPQHSGINSGSVLSSTYVNGGNGEFFLQDVRDAAFDPNQGFELTTWINLAAGYTQAFLLFDWDRCCGATTGSAGITVRSGSIDFSAWGQSTSIPTGISLNGWHQLTLRAAAGTYTSALYVDGVQTGSITTHGVPYSFTPGFASPRTSLILGDLCGSSACTAPNHAFYDDVSLAQLVSTDPVQSGSTLTVNTEADHLDSTGCTQSDCTLREAITAANAAEGTNTIAFNIPGAGVHTITPLTSLPAITDAVTIDGYTQPGAHPSTVLFGAAGDAVLNIVLSGTAASPGQEFAPGLDIETSGSTVKGLVINGGFTYGIEVAGAGDSNNRIVGNYIGTDATGTQASGLDIYGVLIAGNASGNVVGTAAPADRNVISGTTGISPGGGVGVGIATGASGNTVRGNLIGTTTNGSQPLGNATGVMILSGAHDNTVGDFETFPSNIITDNSGAGVQLQQSGTTGNSVAGNFIGVSWILDSGQRIDSGNGADGVLDTESANGNTVYGNIIANNHGNGVNVSGASQVRITHTKVRNSGGLGIDIGGDGVTQNDSPDANGVQNFPVIGDVDSAGGVSGTLDTAPNSTYTIELFTSQACNRSGYGEGQAFVGGGSVTTDANGHVAFALPASLSSTAAYLTATATDASGNTSEFSSCFTLVPGSSLIVNKADDHNDGACSAADCTLREAINAANARPGADTIRFALLPAGAQTIHLTSGLPTITDAVTIDGTSQPGWFAPPIVTIDGSGIQAPIEGTVEGIRITAPNTTVRGLVIDGFPGDGIHVLADNAVIAGNYVGVSPSGGSAAPNSGDGIGLDNANNVVVGGPLATDRNVVGGSGGHGILLRGATNSQVVGNYSGTNFSGTAAIGNGFDGIAVDGGSGNAITGNLASGNHNQGISLFGVQLPSTFGNVVRGNNVGTNALGTGTIPNGGEGIRIYNAYNNTIGGSGSDQGNVVRGNTSAGVAVWPGTGTSTGNTIRGNSISGNGGLGIDLVATGVAGVVTANDAGDGDTGPNNLQNFPVVTGAAAAQVSGTLASAPNTAYTIEVFQNDTCDASGNGEGALLIGSAQATTDANGNASWSIAGSADPSSYVTTTATATVSGDTSEFSGCFQVSSANLNASFTVDQSSTTAGAQSFSLDSLPPELFTQLATGNPSSAPIPSAPIPSAAVGAAPIPSAPIPSAPIPSAPIPSAPIPSAPIPSAPIPSAPIPSAGLAGLPIPSAAISNPLDAILLSSLPGLDVTAMFAGTPIAGKLPQQYTLGDVYRTPSALAYLTANYSVKDLPLGQTLLRGVRTLSYLLGGKTLDKINLPNGQSWCAALTAAGGSCANVDPSKTTVIGLDIMGQLGSLDLGHLAVSNLVGGLNDTLVGEAYVARTAFTQTTLAGMLLSAVPAGLVDCTRINCAAGTTKTLGDAAKLSPTAIKDSTVTLKALVPATSTVTLNELVVALTPRTAFPWEQESYVGWQGFGGQAQQLQYHVDFDTVCPVSSLSVRVKLPFGFLYVPGSTTFAIGSATPVAGSDPSQDPKLGTTWTNVPTVTCAAGQQEHVRLDFKGEAGYKLGPSLSTAIITANGVNSLVTGAPVLVQRNWSAALDRTTAPTIAKDTIVLSHIDTANGTNYFRLAEQGRGKLVTIYMKPPAGSDYDLYVVRPSPASLLASPIPSAPIPSAPIPSAPIPSAPIPSASTSVNTTTDNPGPELLDDGPLPGGQVAVNSITRGDGVEVVSFRQAGNTGYDEIAVAGYNGAYSDQPFELRAQVDDPAPLPANCPVRFPSGGPTAAGQLPVGALDPSTQALALVNVGRMRLMYGATDTNAMLAKLAAVMGSPSVHGAVLQIDGDPGVFAASQAWDQSPCSIDAANNYVEAINALVSKYHYDAATGNNVLPNLSSVTIVGGDEQIPFARVADFVPTSSEFDNTGALSFLTQSGTVDNATYAAAGLGYVLTDDAYGAFHTRTLFGHEFFLPEVAVGRLVETPAEIGGQLDQFIANNGNLSPQTGFVTGYDFMSDAAKAVDDGLSGRIGRAPGSTNTLLRDTWGKSALEPFLTGATPARNINSWNAHYDFHRLMPAVYTGPTDLLSTSLLPAALNQRFQGSILFTMGCHAGESVADTLFSDAALTHDWAQGFSQSGAAVFVGNTGFGYGDTASVALSERLMSLFAGHLAFNGSVGEKFMRSKNEYFASMGAFGPFDEKAIEEATFYGLPFWSVNSPSEPPPTPPATQLDTGGTGLTVAPLTFTPNLTKVADSRGTFWTGGAGSVFVPARSVQPLETRDVTQPAASGLVAHGFFPTSLVTDDSNKGINLYFAKAMIDLGAHEPEPLVTNDVFPANPLKVTQADYLGQRHSTIDLIAGQSRPGPSPSLQNERLVTSLSGLVTYAPSSVTDYTPPRFIEAGSFVSGGSATIFANVADDAPGSVIRVRAFFTTGGPWNFVDLQPVPGVPNSWRASTPVTVPNIEVGFVAEDAAGNTGWMTAKGILVDSFTPTAPPPAPSIVIKQPLDGSSYTIGQSVPSNYGCTSSAGLAACVGPVATGSAFNTTSIGLKQFSVTATPLIGNNATKSAQYNVVYNFGGFQSPISPTAVNVVKAGSAVPVKFSLNGNFGLGILPVGYPKSGSIPCNGGPVVVADATVTAGNSSLQYDAGSDTYSYIWKTDKSWTGCRQLLVALNDGVIRRANFQFK